MLNEHQPGRINMLKKESSRHANTCDSIHGLTHVVEHNADGLHILPGSSFALPMLTRDFRLYTCYTKIDGAFKTYNCHVQVPSSTTKHLLKS